MMRAFFAIVKLCSSFSTERKAKGLEQGTPLAVSPGGRHDRHVHSPRRVHLVVVDLGEDELFGEAKGVIAPPVEALGRKSSEVAHTGDRQGDQPVEELPHAVATKSDLDPDGIALAKLEGSDRLLRPCHDRLLAAYERQVSYRTL